MVGPYDLSASLGCVGDFNSSSYKNTIETLKSKLGSKLGYHLVKDIKTQLEAHKNSKFLALSMDTLFIIDGIKSIESLK
jgi:2-keto-3-deoxy-L-rhamnonate aldolase RhmA